MELGNGQTVRLVGIDTPEVGECGYERAAANLERLVLGKKVRLTVSDEDKDRYGRLLRYVAKRGGFKDLSYRQAYNGFTKRYVFGGKPVARDGQYARAIAQARKNDRGAWGTCW